VTHRQLGFVIFIGACICLYGNTWLAFNATRIIKSGLRFSFAVDLLIAAAVIFANITLWRMAGYPLLSVLVCLPLLAPLLLKGRRHDSRR
jgi:hypothetical protein